MANMRDWRIPLAFASVIMACAASDRYVDGQAVPLTSLFSSNQNDEVPTFGASGGGRKLEGLVAEEDLILTYHNGPLLNGKPEISIYIIFYGLFTETQRSTIRDFLESFSSSEQALPSVSSWWQLTSGYVDSANIRVSQTVKLAADISDETYSHGRILNNSDLEGLVVNSLKTFRADTNSIYLLLTSEDVEVEDFCTNQCASHFATAPKEGTHGQQLPFAWVGNSAEKCPGKCAWPFAKAEYGPNTPALVPPNADVGIDGMIINIASMIVGAATNPFNSGYYLGDGAAPLEAATACGGVFGEGSFAGYPGQLQDDKITGSSFNANGVNGRKFLLPAVWDPTTRDCSPPPSM